MSEPDGTISGKMVFNMPDMSWLTFGQSGLKINLATGEVVIPEGLALDDASRAFWEGLKNYR